MKILKSFYFLSFFVAHFALAITCATALNPPGWRVAELRLHDRVEHAPQTASAQKTAEIVGFFSAAERELNASLTAIPRYQTGPNSRSTYRATIKIILATEGHPEARAQAVAEAQRANDFYTYKNKSLRNLDDDDAFEAAFACAPISQYYEEMLEILQFNEANAAKFFSTTKTQLQVAADAESDAELARYEEILLRERAANPPK